jgi:hypothetical protein
MKRLVSELLGRELDYWVARAQGLMVAKIVQGGEITGYQLYFYSGDTPRLPDYSTDWADGGPIIERERIGLDTWQRTWAAQFTFPVRHPTNTKRDPSHHRMNGESPLVAAMRTFVASRFGDEVTEA